MKLLYPTFFIPIIFLLSCKKENGCFVEKGKAISREFSLPEFQTIDQGIKANFVLSAGVQQSVVVEGDKNMVDLLEKESYVENGTWFLSFGSCVKDYEPLTIYVTLPSYVAFMNHGSGNSSSATVLPTPDDFYLLVGGTGDLSIDLEALTNVTVELTGTGNITLTGQAQQERILVKGNGVVDAFGLTAGQVDIEVKGTGDCLVKATASLNVNISGNGNVYYKGFPVISTDISGNGNVIDAN